MIRDAVHAGCIDTARVGIDDKFPVKSVYQARQCCESGKERE